MLRDLVDLVLPVSCASCALPGVVVCDRCAGPLRGPARRCPPTPAPAGMPTPYAVAAYRDATRALLLAYKERGVLSLDRPLAAALATAVRAAAPAESLPILVPVPSSRRATSQRGEDVVGRLARRAARELRATGVAASAAPALRHHRRVADSAGLSAAARADNLRGAFRVRGAWLTRLRGRRVVLVDDLVTTGATLAECAGVLRAAGVPVVGAATVAATARRQPPGDRGA